MEKIKLIVDKGNIELKNLSKHFGEVIAVDEVSLRIEAGKFFSILGPSGCGKTTMLRMIAGFEKPLSGEVLIDGEVVNGKPPFLRNVNTVFQSYALFPHLNVYENIAFGLKMKKLSSKETKKRVEESLEMIELPNYGRRKISEISGGEKQRVALARALVNRPSILLLDEPLAALDLKLRKQMQLELKSLQREVGITFVYVTHDQGEALAMSDRIAVMNKGKLHQVGTPEEIYERPNDPFVADFIGLSNFLTGRVIKVGQTVEVDLDSLLVKGSDNKDKFVGSQVTIAIRPEKIKLSKSANPSIPNWFECVIEDMVYFGTSTQYTVSLKNDLKLIVHQQNDALPSISSYKIGDQLYVYWNPESVMIL